MIPTSNASLTQCFLAVWSNKSVDFEMVFSFSVLCTMCMHFPLSMPRPQRFHFLFSSHNASLLRYYALTLRYHFFTSSRFLPTRHQTAPLHTNTERRQPVSLRLVLLLLLLPPLQPVSANRRNPHDRRQDRRIKLDSTELKKTPQQRRTRKHCGRSPAPGHVIRLAKTEH